MYYLKNLLFCVFFVSSTWGTDYSVADSSNWSVYDKYPAGATISVVSDGDGSFIKLKGDGSKNGYVIGHWRSSKGWNDTDHKSIEWRMQSSDNFVVYISVNTQKGARYLYYSSKDSSLGISSNGKYIHHGLGTSAKSSDWKTFTRDLEADLKEYESDNELLAINGFLIRGDVLVSTIRTLDKPKVDANVYEDAENGDTVGWRVYDNTPSDAEISNVYDTERESNVIELSGDGRRNAYVLGHWNSAKGWNNRESQTIEWSMKSGDEFVVYISIETTDGNKYIYYYPKNESVFGHSNNNKYFHRGLGEDANDGTWRTFKRNLSQDLEFLSSYSNIKILAVNGFLIRGDARVDDIKLSDPFLDSFKNGGSGPVSSIENLVLNDKKQVYTVLPYIESVEYNKKYNGISVTDINDPENPKVIANLNDYRGLTSPHGYISRLENTDLMLLFSTVGYQDIDYNLVYLDSQNNLSVVLHRFSVDDSWYITDIYTIDNGNKLYIESKRMDWDLDKWETVKDTYDISNLPSINLIDTQIE